MPRWTSAALTASARARDRASFCAGSPVASVCPTISRRQVRELLHHRRDVVEQRLRLRLDRRLAGLEMDAVEVEAALDVERLRHRLAAVLLLELLGRLRRGRMGRGQDQGCGRRKCSRAVRIASSVDPSHLRWRHDRSSLSIAGCLRQQLLYQLPVLRDQDSFGGCWTRAGQRLDCVAMVLADGPEPLDRARIDGGSVRHPPAGSAPTPRWRPMHLAPPRWAALRSASALARPAAQRARGRSRVAAPIAPGCGRCFRGSAPSCR